MKNFCKDLRERATNVINYENDTINKKRRKNT